MRPEYWLYTIPLRLRSLFRWAQADQELDDELRPPRTKNRGIRGARDDARRGTPPRATRPGRYRADQGEMPGRATGKLDSGPNSGFTIWSAHVAQIAWLHRRRRPHPRSGSQCEYCRF